MAKDAYSRRNETGRDQARKRDAKGRGDYSEAASNTRSIRNACDEYLRSKGLSIGVAWTKRH